jgi:hypothetical protein
MVSPPFRGSSPYPHGSLTYRIRFIVSHHPPNGKPFFRKRRIFFALSGKAPRAAALGMQGFRAAAKNIRRPYSLLRRDPADFLMSIHFSLYLYRLLPGLFFLIVVFLVSVFPSAYRPADFSMSIVFSISIFPSVRRPAAAVFLPRRASAISLPRIVLRKNGFYDIIAPQNFFRIGGELWAFQEDLCRMGKC